MGWLSRLLNYVPKAERAGITLDHSSCWRLTGVTKDHSMFLRALPLLLPDGSILYLEDGSPPKHLRKFLIANMLKEACRIAKSTIWPWPKVYHLPTGKEFLFRLAELTENCAWPEVAIHLHAYKDGEVLLEGYDAFLDPFCVSKKIPMEMIRAFCQELGCSYEGETIDPRIR